MTTVCSALSYLCVYYMTSISHVNPTYRSDMLFPCTFYKVVPFGYAIIGLPYGCGYMHGFSLHRIVWKCFPRPYAPRNLVASTPKVRRRDWKCTLLFRRRNAPLMVHTFKRNVTTREKLRLRFTHVVNV